MKFAMAFPGQGSQSLAMMAGYEELPALRETFDEASAALNQDLWKLAEQGPAESMNLTVNTQPLMLAADIAVYRSWLAAGGGEPAMVAGHSLGEYAGLVASGVLDFTDALVFVRERAQVMQDAVPEGSGGIAAIVGLDDEEVIAICAQATQEAGDQTVEAANFNSPAQVVIAGHKAAVERAIELATAQGAKRAMKLPVSVPVHCSLMRPAAEKLRAALESLALRSPRIPVVQNSDALAHRAVADIKDALFRQLFSPVHWVETVRQIAREGVERILECGPGRVLTGLNKRIAVDVRSTSLHDANALREAMTLPA